MYSQLAKWCPGPPKKKEPVPAFGKTVELPAFCKSILSPEHASSETTQPFHPETSSNALALTSVIDLDPFLAPGQKLCQRSWADTFRELEACKTVESRKKYIAALDLEYCQAVKLMLYAGGVSDTYWDIEVPIPYQSLETVTKGIRGLVDIGMHMVQATPPSLKRTVLGFPFGYDWQYLMATLARQLSKYPKEEARKGSVGLAAKIHELKVAAKCRGADPFVDHIEAYL
jgi:hypothetical protein